MKVPLVLLALVQLAIAQILKDKNVQAKIERRRKEIEDLKAQSRGGGERKVNATSRNHHIECSIPARIAWCHRQLVPRWKDHRAGGRDRQLGRVRRHLLRNLPTEARNFEAAEQTVLQLQSRASAMIYSQPLGVFIRPSNTSIWDGASAQWLPGGTRFPRALRHSRRSRRAPGEARRGSPPRWRWCRVGSSEWRSAGWVCPTHGQRRREIT